MADLLLVLVVGSKLADVFDLITSSSMPLWYPSVGDVCVLVSKLLQNFSMLDSM